MTVSKDLTGVRVLTHSAIRLESENGTVLYFDPYDLPDTYHDADAVLITHTHYDHLSPEDIQKVARADKSDTTLIGPESAAKELFGLGFPRTIPLEAGDATEVKGVAIQAVPAYNVKPDRLGFHPKENNWIGYLVVMDDTTYYIAGDTDQTPDNEHIKCDVAIIPIGGTYTMDAEEAAAFVNAINPGLAVPTHYGTAVGAKEDVEAFEPLVNPHTIVVRKMEWH